MKLLPLLLALTAAPLLRAAEPIQAVIVTQSLGTLEGDGPNKTINVLGYQHEITSPRDAASGLPTGRRQHKPFVIVKALDKSTPLLFQCLASNQNLKTATFRFFRPNKDGTKDQYFTVVLTNASVSNIRDWKPNTRDLSADRAGDLEEVSFTYQKISWTWTDGGVTSEDTWSSTN